MKVRFRQLPWGHLLLFLELLLLGIGGWFLVRPSEGILCERTIKGDIPIEILHPREVGPFPAVVLVPGELCTQRALNDLAQALARAGCLVASFDYPGTLENGAELPLFRSSVAHSAHLGALEEELRQVLAYVRSRPDVSPKSLILIGHSLGSVAALRTALVDTSIRATVGLSPLYTAVGSKKPANLLLVVGRWAPRPLREQAMRLLYQAGGEAPEALYGDLAAGTGRRLLYLYGVGHLSLLHSERMLREVLLWVEASLGIDMPMPANLGMHIWLVWFFGVGALLVFPRWARVTWGRSRLEEEGTLPEAWQVLLTGLLAAGVAVFVLWALPWRFPKAVGADYLGPYLLLYGVLSGAILWRTSWSRWPGLARPGVWPLVRHGALALLFLLLTWGVVVFQGSYCRMLPLRGSWQARLLVNGSLIFMALPYFIAGELWVRGGPRRRTRFYWLLDKLT
ncbi:MAG: alpha/beta hydrolase, partial [Anaerolineae bacterium]|nr:alpha/beta hydrolase [Anaerolineae bacterium]